MERKTERTIDRYLRAGALLRLMDSLLCTIWTDVGAVIPKEHFTKRFRKIEGIVKEFKSEVEERMLKDVPDDVKALPGKFTRVCYGNVSQDPMDDLDAMVQELAKLAADELFM